MNAGADYGVHVMMVIRFRHGSQFRLDRYRSMASQANSVFLIRLPHEPEPRKRHEHRLEHSRNERYEVQSLGFSSLTRDQLTGKLSRNFVRDLGDCGLVERRFLGMVMSGFILNVSRRP